MPNRLERTRILCEYKPIASSAGATNRQKNSNSRATRPSSFVDVPSTPWSLHRSRPPSTRSPRVRSSSDRSTGSSRLEDARPRSLFPGQRPVVARAAVAAASTHLSRPANRASTSRPSCANQPIDRNNYFPSVVLVVKSTARARRDAAVAHSSVRSLSVEAKRQRVPLRIHRTPVVVVAIAMARNDRPREIETR